MTPEQHGKIWLQVAEDMARLNRSEPDALLATLGIFAGVTAAAYFREANRFEKSPEKDNS